MNRSAVLLGDVSPDAAIMELGPSVSPIAPRSAGWNVTVVDHATREELVAKYQSHPNVDTSKVEAVDILWRNGPLDGSVPAGALGTFDLLIASHVIEHIPDPIGFFQAASRILHPQRGVLALAVPDKRFCFDCLKPVSTTGQILAAHKIGSQRHTAATRFDYAAYNAFDRGRTGWGREPVPDLKLVETLETAYADFMSATDGPDAAYVDCHAWQFTPASFELLILELGALGIIDWRIGLLAPSPAVEFLVRLVPGREQFTDPAHREQRRLDLLKTILLEAREQTDWLQQTAPVQADNLDAVSRRQIAEIAETAAVVRAALRPCQAIWRHMLPARRVVARMRGRIA